MTAEEENREEQILAAAFDEFAKKGFKGATIKNIATAAGLKSPSLIYWYFPTKEDLFQAVLSSRAQLLKLIADPTLHMEKRPEIVLPRLAHSYMGMIKEPGIQKFFRFALAEIIKRPELANLVGEKMMFRVLDFLESYFTRQIELGRLRPHDVSTSAKAFMGLLVPQAFGLLLFPPLQTRGADEEGYVMTIVDIFLSGLRPGATTDEEKP